MKGERRQKKEGQRKKIKEEIKREVDACTKKQIHMNKERERERERV